MQKQNNNTILLGIGSMGCSTVAGWIKNKLLKADEFSVILVHKDSRSLVKYSREIRDEAAEWCLDVSDLYSYDDTERRKNCILLQEYVSARIRRFVNAERMIVVAGLGKTMGSIAVPVILEAAGELGIKTHSLCTLPFGFETETASKRAEMILPVICQLSSAAYFVDNSDFENMPDGDVQPFSEVMGTISSCFLSAIEQIRKNRCNQNGVYRINVTKKTTACRKRFEEIYLQTLEKYDVTGEICNLIDTRHLKTSDVSKVDEEEPIDDMVLPAPSGDNVNSFSKGDLTLNRQAILWALIGFIRGRGYGYDDEFGDCLLCYIQTRDIAEEELMAEACSLIDAVAAKGRINSGNFEAAAAVMKNKCEFSFELERR